MASELADAVGPRWESEEIPDADLLYMRVHFRFVNDDGSIQPGAFRDQGEAMSTDWEKYSTPEQTCNRLSKGQDNAVISLRTSGVRAIPDQLVVHTPDPETNNQAHTDVFGDKKKNTQVRILYSRLYELIIPTLPESQRVI